MPPTGSWVTGRWTTWRTGRRSRSPATWTSRRSTRAMATVRRYLLDVAGDSGLERVVPGSVRVERAPAGPKVTVELRAATPAAFLRYLHVVAPEMVGSATATAELLEP